jgi:hypothetical protein
MARADRDRAEDEVPSPNDAEDDRVADDDPVERASEDSFPASDPPPFWAGPPTAERT